MAKTKRDQDYPGGSNVAGDKHVHSEHSNVKAATQKNFARSVEQITEGDLFLVLTHSAQVRKFATDQYTQAGLQLHSGCNPLEIRKQQDGRLTAVIKAKDGSTVDLGDNDYVLMATGEWLDTSAVSLCQNCRARPLSNLRGRNRGLLSE